jgi:N-acylneuraminate cytidylyltransferase
MTKKNPSIVALIPARAGSKRVLDKNIRPLAGHPLIAYTISSALQSQVFSAVIVSTDSQLYGDIAGHYGAEVPHSREKKASIHFVRWKNASSTPARCG